jgi:hypothetical protein
LSPSEVVASGSFHGVGECVAVLHEIAGGELFTGWAFGVSWPCLSKQDLVVAPALPVVVGPTPVSGADGEYQRRIEGVWREAAGVETLLLEERETPAQPGRPFDLLWFENTARYLVRAGVLEIEDLFAVLRVPATSALLSRTLIGRRKLPKTLLDGVGRPANALASEIEVGRPRELSSGDRWRDALRALEVRADVLSVHRRGAEMIAETERGDTVVFSLAEGDDGWQLERQAGAYAFTRLALTRRGESLWLSGVLDSMIDPMAPGMRERLAYDLRADLVALG